MIAESSRGTEARWTDGTAGCPGGVRGRVERPNQLNVASHGVARLHRSYAWGLDASGTLTGAGGVGGLLLTSHHTPQADGSTQVTTLAPLYDFNGNVLAYADVATSTITHRIEYDPFGQELSLDTLLPGEGAAEAPRFRFSTKYTDGETGLVYYGYRSYSPELGRWVNRDPIEEEGGINLYGMVGNDAVNRVDVLGLREVYYLRNRGMIGHGWLEHPGGPEGTTSLHFSQISGDAFGPARFEERGPQNKKPVSMHMKFTKVDSPDEKLGGTGKSCKCATCDDIYQCLKGQFECAVAEGYNVVTRNCRIVSVSAARSCCLKDNGSRPGAP